MKFFYVFLLLFCATAQAQSPVTVSWQGMPATPAQCTAIPIFTVAAAPNFDGPYNPVAVVTSGTQATVSVPYTPYTFFIVSMQCHTTKGVLYIASSGVLKWSATP